MAHADPLSDLAGRLKITAEPTDYVLLVDTSSSMQQQGRWGRVRAAVGALANQLKDSDRVTLITFDDGVRQTWTATSPSASQLVGRLPATPTGDQTDIGAAIDAGVTALGGSGARKVAAIVLLTDGELDASSTSKYPTATSGSWTQLRSRADQTRKNREVGAFAVAVGDKTDAGLLTKVFPQASVATPADISGYLAGITTELTKARIGQALATDLGKPATLTLSDVVRTDDTITATATWVSHTTQLPLTVTGVALDGGTAQQNPATVTLAPGATATSTITLTGDSATKPLLKATLGSPWARELTAAGLTLPKVNATVVVPGGPSKPVATVSQRPSGGASTPAPTGGTDGAVVGTVDGGTARPTWLLPAALGALVLIAALGIVLAVVRARRPRLDGSMAIVRDGQVAHEFVLDGVGSSAQRGAVTVKVSALRDGRVAVKGTRRVEGGKPSSFSGVLADGESLEVGDGHVLRYTAQRTRMLDMVKG
ncbi:vWA domain-containing protein [Aestuariimicrobium soli]|uniref:vWA domain-containing protein n=1 Tax=Aestuariimicrobium soli TaxID=2035834 RepID=UPI003EBBE73F